MIKWLIKQLQKFDKDTYTGDLPQTKAQKEHKEEPRVEITGFAVDPNNPGQGAFEFDWNKEFIYKLISEGYVGDSDEDLVEQWFSDICRNVVLETYEQERARIGHLGDMSEFDNLNYNVRTNLTRKRDLGNGKAEFE
jgi:hypothetical protein